MLSNSWEGHARAQFTLATDTTMIWYEGDRSVVVVLVVVFVSNAMQTRNNNIFPFFLKTPRGVTTPLSLFSFLFFFFFFPSLFQQLIRRGWSIVCSTSRRLLGLEDELKHRSRNHIASLCLLCCYGKKHTHIYARSLLLLLLLLLLLWLIHRV